MRKFKEWFKGETEIPPTVWYAVMTIGAIIYVTSIITSMIINN